MSPITQRIILFAIALIEYAMAWNPAPTPPDIEKRLTELTNGLQKSQAELDAARQSAGG